MRTKITKALSICFLLFSATLFANLSNAQCQCIEELDYYEHEVPRVNPGDLLGVFVYQSGNYASFPYNPWDYTVTAQVHFYYGGKRSTVDVDCSIFSSGVELIAPQKPYGAQNVSASLYVIVHDNTGKCNTYYFYKDLHYK